MATYADRYAAALGSILGDDVTVTNGQGLIVIELGAANVAIWAPSTGDKRRPVSLAAAQEGLASAARKLRGEIPKYREEFKAPAHILADFLHARSTPESAPDGFDDGTTADALAPVERPRR